jgi:hypothetical protein
VALQQLDPNGPYIPPKPRRCYHRLDRLVVIGFERIVDSRNDIGQVIHPSVAASPAAERSDAVSHWPQPPPVTGGGSFGAARHASPPAVNGRAVHRHLLPKNHPHWLALMGACEGSLCPSARGVARLVAVTGLGGWREEGNGCNG